MLSAMTLPEWRSFEEAREFVRSLELLFTEAEMARLHTNLE